MNYNKTPTQSRAGKTAPTTLKRQWKTRTTRLSAPCATASAAASTIHSYGPAGIVDSRSKNSIRTRRRTSRWARKHRNQHSKWQPLPYQPSSTLSKRLRATFIRKPNDGSTRVSLRAAPRRCLSTELPTPDPSSPDESDEEFPVIRTTRPHVIITENGWFEKDFCRVTGYIAEPSCEDNWWPLDHS